MRPRSNTAQHKKTKGEGEELLVTLVMGLLVFLRNEFFLQELTWQRNLAISLTLGTIVLFATLIGIFVPLLLSSVRMNHSRFGAADGHRN